MPKLEAEAAPAKVDLREWCSPIEDPYEYVLAGLASDWWVLIENEWVDTGEFQV